MNLKPRQWLGLAAIIVFGGGMIFRLTQPSEREIMEQRLASLPRIEVPAVEFPMPDLSGINTPITPPPSLLEPGAPVPDAPVILPPDDNTSWLTIGSQAAKDDFYCSGILGAEFDVRIALKYDPKKPETHPDAAVPLMDMQKKLDTAGVEKLKAEKLSDGSDWAFFTNTWGEKAEADYKAGALRIPVATCIERAKPLPPGTLY
jgi:hypothetical protein